VGRAVPRPYSRHNLIAGTKGVLAGFPNRFAIEGVNSFHEWTEGEAWEKFVAQYEHPLLKRIGELAKKMGGHGGMDFIELFRMVECCRTGCRSIRTSTKASSGRRWGR